MLFLEEIKGIFPAPHINQPTMADECELIQERITDPVCDLKVGCCYCPNEIDDIDTAPVIFDCDKNTNNLVCSFKCEGVPDEVKDNCAYCGALYFGKTDVCDSCWITAYESCMLDD